MTVRWAISVKRTSWRPCYSSAWWRLIYALERGVMQRSIYDETHRPYHYYHAYKLTCDGFKSIDALIDEQKIPYQKDGNLFNFKAWFEANFELSDFSDYKDFKNGAETRASIMII